MLLLPLGVGLLGVSNVTVASLILPPAAVLLFLARFASVPGGTRSRSGRALRWSVFYFLASAAGLAVAVARTTEPSRSEALGLAVAVGGLGFGNAGLVRAGRGRSIGAEVAAMGSAALLAPLVMVVGEKPLGGDAIAAGLLCFAYFLSSLVTVRTFRSGRAATNVAAHAGLTVALLGVWWAAELRPGLLLAFAPVLVRVGVSTLRRPRHLRSVGMREIAVSVALVAIAGVALRS
jgi:hypothetical protein